MVHPKTEKITTKQKGELHKAIQSDSWWQRKPGVFLGWSPNAIECLVCAEY